MIEAESLGQVAGIRHGFFTREGGTSTGLFTSLNCGFGSGDDRDRVAANRRRAMDRLGRRGEDLVTGYQIHSAAVSIVDSAWQPEAAPKVDGLATRRPGVVLGILTADCAPVLFADAEAGVIGAGHAGWKGALTGISEAVVSAMESLGAARKRIVAAVGPCIHQVSYEVGPEFRATFVSEDPSCADFFVPSERAGHHRFDLPGYVRRRLEGLGLKSVEVLPHDTCGDANRFFSYRRATKQGERDYGRGLSAIGLAG
jgi:YfiH family protein